MNIDVKNAFDKVIVVCDGITSQMGVARSLKRVFAEDIFTFISAISIDGAEERYSYFNKLYFHNEFESKDFYIQVNDIPCLLKEFCELDATVLSSKNFKSVELLISFFTTLGKSYILNPMDKKQIDVQRFSTYIKSMSTFVQENTFQQKKSEKTPLVQKENANLTEKVNNTEGNAEPEKTLEELLEELESLIGLSEVKKEVSQIINVVKVQKKAEEFGEKITPLSLHLVFYGNPGTGKTTIARLLAKIYKSIGVLSNGQLIETDRSGLVGGYVGQTALKTKEVIDKALGGILFIDEAYTLTHGKGDNDFGQEAVDTILKAMEDYRDDFIVIVAGYPKLMREFVASNPGLKSRFNQYINFEDYKPDELKSIFSLLCKNENLNLSNDCSKYLDEFFENMYNNRSDDYANGRDVRNFFEKTLKARANRIAPILDQITKEDFKTILLCDLENAEVINTKI